MRATLWNGAQLHFIDTVKWISRKGIFAGEKSTTLYREHLLGETSGIGRGLCI